MSELPHLLIVDSSRVVRASLAKNLKGQFEIREENNGESAWQTLVLDSSIVAVIAGISLPKLDAYGLLERLRGNKLSRLKNIPFLLIASETMEEDIRQHAIGCGVSGFVPKGAGAAGIVRIVRNLLAPAKQEALPKPSVVRPPIPAEPSCLGADLGVSDIFGPLDKVAGIVSRKSASRVIRREPVASALVSRAEIEARLNTLLSAEASLRGVGVLVFGMDGYGGLVKRFGQEMANRIETKFGQLLGGKLRAGDSIAQVAADRIVIVASETNLKLCAAFAERICKRLAAAEVSVGGRRVEMTVSVGVVSFPEEGGGLKGSELLAMAERRLEMAVKAGGNQVVAGLLELAGKPGQEQVLQCFNELLRKGAATETLAPHLGQVGLLILPLLEQLEDSFRFGLPIEKMEQLLRERAKTEPALG
ncbi:GGDEF domain-containing response regulator [Dechloromonas hortensis]|uniref:GGDEF domain-containing response regulator n=1 Tax=Dechloromonas hortensis TaxID=337779 RepID=UPI001291924D|nr:diguanylate cyclase [Dechloromonas hortensis]